MPYCPRSTFCKLHPRRHAVEKQLDICMKLHTVFRHGLVHKRLPRWARRCWSCRLRDNACSVHMYTHRDQPRRCVDLGCMGIRPGSTRACRTLAPDRCLDQCSDQQQPYVHKDKVNEAARHPQTTRSPAHGSPDCKPPHDMTARQLLNAWHPAVVHKRCCCWLHYGALHRASATLPRLYSSCSRPSLTTAAAAPTDLNPPLPVTELITSPANTYIRHCVKLRESARYRQQQRRVLLVGRNLLQELAGGHTPYHIHTRQYHECLQLAGPTSSQPQQMHAMHADQPTVHTPATPAGSKQQPSASGEPNTLVLACPCCACC